MVPLVVLLQLLCCLLLASSSYDYGAPGNGHDGLLMTTLDRFHRWMDLHGRSYPDADEKLRRFEVYRRNVEYIDSTNRDGRLGYELGENEFTDLTSEEFVARYTGGLIANDSAVITTPAGDVNEGYIADGGEDDDPAKLQITPPNVDWRNKGAVTPVKNQNPCNSCWAFAAVATVESQHKIRTGELVSLSEQEVLDCDRNDQRGCGGGWAKNALEWIKAKGGVMTEAAYPYVTYQQQYCYSSAAARRVGKIVAVRQLAAGSEAALTTAVAVQPVAVMIEAKINNYNMQHYRGGIYEGPCTKEVNHVVTVVGYGRDDVHRTDYWILKNSWGQKWGDKGFMYLRKGADGRDGLCGIVKTGGVYPVMHGMSHALAVLRTLLYN
ncbi:hypothetical protein GUJ93_ZPchr0009g2250 [Zizania palustris]|uniref:Uncharacterized protein n=1 Tax=Zizania palustris TaxID=103762 RepID=A0A8J5VKL1_ZIZPA|nr:hypothetical protein GUJ93_ZPchr0009g2250 [Zizania palustris]